MKKAMGYNGTEYYMFGPDNKLRIFPPNTFNFKPKDHIVVDEIQGCILDNLWYQYNHRKDDKGYLLSNLNSLAEYFNMMNGILPQSENIGVPELKPLYVLYDGKTPGIYLSFEKILAEKIEAKYTGGASWKKYTSIDEALNHARKMLGVNYYIEPIAKEYIQQHKLAQNRNAPKYTPPTKAKEEGQSSGKKPTYKECLIKGVDPLDGEYIDLKIEEKYNQIYAEMKKDLKEEVLKEVLQEMTTKFDNMKKEYDAFELNNFLNDDGGNKTDIKMEDSQLQDSQLPE